MLIILEGVDGSGKSSLASAIVDDLKKSDYTESIRELHSGPLKRDPLEEYVFSIDDYAPSTESHIVADRWHYGELIYGPLYRGKSAINTAQWRWMEMWLQSRGASVWIVSNTVEEIKRRLAARGEDFLKDEDVKTVVEGYLSLIKTNHPPTFEQVITVDGDLTWLVNEIRTWANNAAIEARNINELWPSYVGPTAYSPKFLLVGDKRGGKPPYRTQSAFMPVGGNSADFLWNALEEGVWQQCGMINAHETDFIPGLIEHLGRPHVVALGHEASKKLTHDGVTHARVPHPQYVRRFHSKKRSGYGQLIYDAALTQEDHSKWLK